MRRRMLALLLFAAALNGLPRGARAQTIPAYPGGSLSSVTGVPVDVPIVVDMSSRTDRLGSFAARLQWNPAVLRSDLGAAGTFGALTVNADSVLQGVIRFAGANPAGASGAVVLLVARFTPLSADTTTLRLSVSELFAAVSFANLLPSLSVTNRQYCPARGRFGDINADALVNSADALIAVTHAVGLPVGSVDVTLGDLDGDGRTDTRDALAILSYAVGLPTPGFRVLRLAGGSCSANPLVTLAVLPAATGTLLPEQQVQLEVRASDASGVPQTVVGVRWRSTNSSVATVDSLGSATAVAAGSATIWAIRDGRDSAQVALTVAARRTNHFVSADAASAINQIGTSALPFATLDQAAAIMTAGDTVRVAAGRYESATFASRVVLIGQTGAVISGTGGAVGLTLDGAGRSEIHNLAIEGFLVGLQLGAVDTVLADSLRVLARGGSATCYEAAVKVDEAWAVILRHAQLVGDGRDTGCAVGVYAYGNVRLLAIEDGSITDFGDGGVFASSTDSILIRRSHISFNGYSPLYAYAYGVGGVRVPAPADVAVVAERSRFEGNIYSDAIQVFNLRRLRVANSVIAHRQGYSAFDLGGNGSGYVQLVGDSILLDNGDWMYVDGGVDSVVVDSTRVTGGYDGDFYDIRLLRVTNSSFTEMTCGDAFYLYSYPTPVLVAFDSVTVGGGGGGYSQCQDGIVGYFYGTVHRTVWDDLYDVIYPYSQTDQSQALTITRSAFRNTYTGVYVDGYQSPQPPRLKVSSSTFTDVSYPIEAGDVVAVLDTLSITRAYDAIYTWGTGPDTVRFSTLSAVQSYDIDLEDAPAYVANNTLTDVTDLGIYLYGPYPPGSTDSLVAVNNTIACVPSSSYAWGIEADYGQTRIQGNTITGCNQGIYVYHSGTPVGALIRGNTVSLSSSGDENGIEVTPSVRARVVGNTVSGGGTYSDGGIVLRGYSYSPVPWARVDSNTVQQVRLSGIRAEYVDSLEIRGNLVEDVAPGYYYQTSRGGIGVFGSTRYAARVAGNTVRRPRSFGIAIDQLDTATVFADSNAVSAADTGAVRIGSGSVRMRHNNIRNNSLDGVLIDGVGSVTLSGNAFKGNARYAVNHTGDAGVSITGNWWGVNSSPPGAPGTDSVSGVQADPSPLAAEPIGLPPLAPPLMRIAAAGELWSATDGAASETSGRSSRPRRTQKPVREARIERTPRGRPVVASEARVTQDRASRLAMREGRRAELAAAVEAARAGRDSVHSARAAERIARGSSRP